MDAGRFVVDLIRFDAMSAAMPTSPAITGVATMSDRFENDDDHTRHPDWLIEKRDCVFCTIDRRICGCPAAERAEDLRAQHYEGMGVE